MALSIISGDGSPGIERTWYTMPFFLKSLKSLSAYPELRKELFPVTRSILLPYWCAKYGSSAINPFLKQILGNREN
jgi:hypothetical protein